MKITLVSLVNQIVGVIDTAIPILASFAVFFFLLNIVRYIYKAGDAGSKGAEKKGILWGLIALFVIFSIWGLLSLFRSILFSGTATGSDLYI